ncbi:hypothetical protein GFK82_00783 [Candidatus Steffania adelgidicola]|nr:hypothetical protein GFK82_00783 [Candidatus Steffania adelgidicola]
MRDLIFDNLSINIEHLIDRFLNTFTRFTSNEYQWVQVKSKKDISLRDKNLVQILFGVI